MEFFFFNENKVAEMAQILDCLHKYVPSQAMEKVFTLPDGTKISRGDYHHVPVLLGGDQLTVARARGAQAIRSSHDNATERLSGIIPVVEDWHARQTLMEVNLYICYLNI